MKEDGPRPGRSVCVVTQSSGSQEVPSIVLVQAWRSLRRRVRKHPTRRRSEAARQYSGWSGEREKKTQSEHREIVSLVGSRRLLAGGRQSATTTTSQAKGTSTGAAVSGIDRQTSARSFFLFIVLYRGGTTRGSPASKEIVGIDWVQQQKS